MADTDILQIPEISESQSSKYVTHNEAIRQIEAILAGGIVDRDNGGPPGSPSNGDVYIVDNATGTWSAAGVNDIAYYYGSSWHFYTPVEGVRVWVKDENIEVIYDGNNWADIMAYIADSIVCHNNQVICNNDNVLIA